MSKMKRLSTLVHTFVALGVGVPLLFMAVLHHKHLAEGSQVYKQDEMASNSPDVNGDFVICVGPMKTGSTFLQESLCNAHAQDILAKDNYVFRGTCLAANKVDGVIRREKNNTQTDVTRSMIPMIQGTRARNGIFVNELLSLYDQTNETYVSSLAKEILNTQFPRPIIVVNYRRFFEQYLSNFNQIQRPKGGKLGWPRPNLPESGHETQPFRTPNQLCNSDTNATDLFYRIFCSHDTSRTQVYRDLYAQSFETIKILDMHDTNKTKYDSAGDAYMQQFLCEVVPNAPHACAAARKGQIGGGNRNPSQVLHYDVIGVEAWKRGWLGCNGIRFKITRWLRRDAYLSIRKYQEEILNLTWKDLPLVCPSRSDLRQFLMTSLVYERQLFPKTWKNRQSDHVSAFRDAVLKLKFCSVNATRVLENDGWRQYIQSLGASKACGGKIQATADLAYYFVNGTYSSFR